MILNKLPDFSSELMIKAVRSSGKGGQNVNKVSSKVELTFDVNNSTILNEEQKAILLDKLATKISSEGVLRIVSQEDRSQLRNKEIAIKKFYHILQKAFEKQKPRKATKPSKASRVKRLLEKKLNSLKKENRKF